MREKCLEFENVCGKGRKYKLYDISPIIVKYGRIICKSH